MSGGGNSQSAQKKHARASILVVSTQPVIPIPTDLITFSSSDLQAIHFPHDNPLVVTLSIANYSIKRVLIDTSSSSDILFAEAFN